MNAPSGHFQYFLDQQIQFLTWFNLKLLQLYKIYDKFSSWKRPEKITIQFLFSWKLCENNIRKFTIFELREKFNY